MAINIAYKSHTALSISTTEISFNTGTSTLTPDTTPGYFQLWLDMANLAAGDVFEVYLTEVVRSGGTARKTLIYNAVGGQVDPFVSPPQLLGNGWFYSMKRISGTDRAVDATVRAVT